MFLFYHFISIESRLIDIFLNSFNFLFKAMCYYFNINIREMESMNHKMWLALLVCLLKTAQIEKSSSDLKGHVICCSKHFARRQRSFITSFVSSAIVSENMPNWHWVNIFYLAIFLLAYFSFLFRYYLIRPFLYLYAM